MKRSKRQGTKAGRLIQSHRTVVGQRSFGACAEPGHEQTGIGHLRKGRPMVDILAHPLKFPGSGAVGKQGITETCSFGWGWGKVASLSFGRPIQPRSVRFVLLACVHLV